MKIRSIIILTLIVSFQLSCSFANETASKHVIDVPEFSKAIEKIPDIQLLDVRTPKEFQEGHIQGATNFDWLGDYFNLQITNLDKNKPVYVYCMSGKRSSDATEVLLKNGFEVYELTGGILNWRKHQMPEVSEKPAKGGMGLEDFNGLVNQSQPVLVDFYAPWCAPCKVMEPYLNKIADEGQVNVLRINIDEHKKIAKEFKIYAIPLLKLYKDGKIVWQHNGSLNEVGIRKGLEKAGVFSSE